MGAVSAQVDGSSGSATNALWSNPVTAQFVDSSGNVTNTFQAGPSINGEGSSGLGRRIGEPTGLDMNLWQSDVMAVHGGDGWAFVDPEGIRVQRAILFHNLDLLVRAETHHSPVFFGVDSEVKFVEQHDYQPGIPVPVGMSFRKGPQRWTFFAEFAPILDSTSATALGWGGGIGIRYYFVVG